MITLSPMETVNFISKLIHTGERTPNTLIWTVFRLFLMSFTSELEPQIPTACIGSGYDRLQSEKECFSLVTISVASLNDVLHSFDAWSELPQLKKKNQSNTHGCRVCEDEVEMIQEERTLLDVNICFISVIDNGHQVPGSLWIYQRLHDWPFKINVLPPFIHSLQKNGFILIKKNILHETDIYWKADLNQQGEYHLMLMFIWFTCTVSWLFLKHSDLLVFVTNIWR